MALKLSVEVQAVTKDAVDRLDKLRAKLRELGSGGNFATKELEGVTAKLQTLSSGVRTATGQIAAGGKRARDGLTPVSQQLGTIQGQLVALASGFSVFQAFRQFITATDQVSNLNAQLRLATKSSEEFAAAQSIVTDIANTFGIRIGDAAQSFARLSQAIAGLGGGLREASALTEALSAATKVSGVSVQEAAASMIQFAQALGSGVLQGDELRSILENNRRLAKALADGLGVSVGELKKLGEAGALTSEVVAKAVLSQLGALRAEAELVPDTVERAGNRLFNAFATWVTASEQAGNAQSNVISFINALAANMDRVISAVQIAGTVIVGLFAGRAIQAVVQFVAQLRVAIAAIGTMGLTLSALGGPISIALGLVSALAGALLLFGTNAANANDLAREKTEQYIQALERQVEVQQRASAGTPAQAQEVEDQLSVLQRRSKFFKDEIERVAKLNDAIDKTGVLKDDPQVNRLLLDLVEVEQQITRITTAQNKLKQSDFFSSQAAQVEKLNRETRTAGQQFFELAKQFQTEAEKNQELIKELRDLGAKGQVRPDVIESTVARVGRRRQVGTDTSFRSALINEERTSLEAETRLQSDAIQRQERELRESYERRAISAQEFFTQRKDLQLEAIDVEIRQLTRLREIEESIASGPDSTAADRVRSGTEVLKINRDIAIQTRRRGDVEQEAASDIVKANKEVQESLEQVRFRLKELTGTATLDDIRKNALAGRRELFDSLAGDDQAQLDVIKLVNIEAVQTQLTQLQSQADQVLSSLSAKQEEISLKAEIGSLSAEDAENSLNAERLRSAGILDELIKRMNALRDGNISAFGPEQDAAIQRYGQRLRELTVIADQTAREMKAAFQGPLSNLFEDLITGTKSAKDAFEDFADAVVNALIRIAAQKAAEAVLSSMFGTGQNQTAQQAQGGSNQNTAQTIGTIAQLASFFFAQGGMVRGPGTTTSDSIPAMLSKDEFVVKASTVRKVGPETMYALNSGNPKLIEALKTATHRFNSGGLVGDYRSDRSNTMALRDVAKVSDRSEKVSVLKTVRDALSRWSGSSERSATQSVVVVDRSSTESNHSAYTRESERSVRDVTREASMVLRAMSAVRDVRESVTSAVRESSAYGMIVRAMDRVMGGEKNTETVVRPYDVQPDQGNPGVVLAPAPSGGSQATLTAISKDVRKEIESVSEHVVGAPGHAGIVAEALLGRQLSDRRVNQSDSSTVSASSSTASDKTYKTDSANILIDRAAVTTSEIAKATESSVQSERSESERVRERAELSTKIAAHFFRDAFGIVSRQLDRVFNAPRITLERLIDVSRETREQRFSAGGMVRGPGTTTSDSVPARLSREEFVVRADTVRKVGPSVMYALNAGHPKILHALRVASEGVQNFTSNISTPGFKTEFATGGLVMPDPTVNNTTNRQATVNFVVNTPDVSGITKNQTQITQELVRAMRAAGARS